VHGELPDDGSFGPKSDQAVDVEFSADEPELQPWPSRLLSELSDDGPFGRQSEQAAQAGELGWSRIGRTYPESRILARASAARWPCPQHGEPSFGLAHLARPSRGDGRASRRRGRSSQTGVSSPLSRTSCDFVKELGLNVRLWHEADVSGDSAGGLLMLNGPGPHEAATAANDPNWTLAKQRQGILSWTKYRLRRPGRHAE
jgi:hypothetical protein